jgi:pimeloyl-ACP methyl ester carboxylesterase
VDDSIVTDELVEIYYWTSHQRGARHAPAAFISGHLNIDVRQALRRLSQPTLLVWGEEGIAAPSEESRAFRALKPDLEMVLLSPAGDLPHDERPDDFNVNVSSWLNRLSLSSGPTPGTLPGTPEASPLTLPHS